MRGRDDHAAANQRAIDALYRARLRAVADCQGRLAPDMPGDDRSFDEPETLATVEHWDRLNVAYLRAEWPPSMLN
jgi:hypothetical protein